MTPKHSTSLKPFKFNGFVVTTQEPQNYMLAGSEYRGVAYGRPWPLEDSHSGELTSGDVELAEQVRSAITSQPFAGGSYPLALITDFELVQLYQKRCTLNGIPVRTLLVATHDKYPTMDRKLSLKLSQDAQFLGFDYVSSQMKYSAVFDDLNPPFSPDIVSLVSRMNLYGLFADTSSLEEYISARWDFVQFSEEYTKDYGEFAVRVSVLEDNVELIRCEVYEVKI